MTRALRFALLMITVLSVGCASLSVRSLTLKEKIKRDNPDLWSAIEIVESSIERECTSNPGQKKCIDLKKKLNELYESAAYIEELLEKNKLTSY